MRIKETIKYVLSEKNPQAPMSWDLGKSWATAVPKSKTAKAVCWHCWRYGWGPVLKVRFSPPISSSEWLVEDQDGNAGDFRVYATTRAEVSLIGSKDIVKVKFYQEFCSGQPKTHGKGWFVTITD